MCLAVPGEIISVAGRDLTRTGRVSFAGIVKEVNLAYVPEAGLGDFVMVHVGFAISRVERDEARKVFEYLDQMDELQEIRESALHASIPPEEATLSTSVGRNRPQNLEDPNPNTSLP